MLGVDPVEISISTARLHSSSDPELGGRLRYRACTVEELLGTEEAEMEEAEETGEGPFDAVVASEVVEHLADLETFAFCCGHLIKVGSTCDVFFGIPFLAALVLGARVLGSGALAWAVRLWTPGQAAMRKPHLLSPCLDSHHAGLCYS